MSKIIILLLFSFSFLTLFMSHPLSIGMSLLFQTILTAMITGLLSYNFWFSYILFLIMVGGMLILFIYMTSVASNEKFKFNFNLYLFIILMLMFLLTFMIDTYLLNFSQSSNDLILTESSLNWKSSLTKFMSWNLINNFFMMILYLFITLIMVVKITNIQNGPLRQTL